MPSSQDSQADRIRQRLEEQDDRKEREAANAILTHGFNLVFKLAVVAAFALLIFYGMRYAYSFGYSVFTTPTMEEAPGKDVSITILEGQSVRSVGEELAENGLVAGSSIFVVQAKIYGYTILPGTYTLNTSQTIYEMLRVMSEKK